MLHSKGHAHRIQDSNKAEGVRMQLAAPGKAGIGIGTYLMAEPLTLVLKWPPRQRYSSR